MIAIVDYGMGNLRSVQKAFEKLGYNAVITSDCAEIASATHVVLPGVGAFKEAMEQLVSSGVADVIKEQIAIGKPFLGICLGMQMLFCSSQEEGYHKGLSLLDGDIELFDVELKVPHMGWNSVEVVDNNCLYKDIDDKYFYFVHSYKLDGGNRYASGICDYGCKFACSVQYNNIFGVQFHPEKSGDSGLKLLDNFAKLRGVKC